MRRGSVGAVGESRRCLRGYNLAVSGLRRGVIIGLCIGEETNISTDRVYTVCYF